MDKKKISNLIKGAAAAGAVYGGANMAGGADMVFAAELDETEEQASEPAQEEVVDTEEPASTAEADEVVPESESAPEELLSAPEELSSIPKEVPADPEISVPVPEAVIIPEENVSPALNSEDAQTSQSNEESTKASNADVIRQSNENKKADFESQAEAGLEYAGESGKNSQSFESASVQSETNLESDSESLSEALLISEGDSATVSEAESAASDISEETSRSVSTVKSLSEDRSESESASTSEVESVSAVNSQSDENRQNAVSEGSESNSASISGSVSELTRFSDEASLSDSAVNSYSEMTSVSMSELASERDYLKSEVDQWVDDSDKMIKEGDEIAAKYAPYETYSTPQEAEANLDKYYRAIIAKDLGIHGYEITLVSSEDGKYVYERQTGMDKGALITIYGAELQNDSEWVERYSKNGVSYKAEDLKDAYNEFLQDHADDYINTKKYAPHADFRGTEQINDDGSLTATLYLYRNGIPDAIEEKQIKCEGLKKTGFWFFREFEGDVKVSELVNRYKFANTNVRYRQDMSKSKRAQSLSADYYNYTSMRTKYNEDSQIYDSLSGSAASSMSEAMSTSATASEVMELVRPEADRLSVSNKNAASESLAKAALESEQARATVVQSLHMAETFAAANMAVDKVAASVASITSAENSLAASDRMSAINSVKEETSESYSAVGSTSAENAESESASASEVKAASESNSVSLANFIGKANENMISNHASLSTSASEAASLSVSNSESQSISVSLAQSASESTADSVIKSESQEQSQSISESESKSASESRSESEKKSEAESRRESERKSESASESVSEASKSVVRGSQTSTGSGNGTAFAGTPRPLVVNADTDAAKVLGARKGAAGINGDSREAVLGNRRDAQTGDPAAIAGAATAAGAAASTGGVYFFGRKRKNKKDKK